MGDNKNILKISFQNLRELIDTEKKEWFNVTDTNCYAYALGLDIREDDIVDCAYAPGVMSCNGTDLFSYMSFTYEQLLNNIDLDFNALGIDYREINPLDKVDIDEWKIALFTSKYYDYIDDYHFIRQHSDGRWFHKRGYHGNISRYDDHSQIILNPKDAYFNCYEYNKCLCLKLKK